MAYENTNWYTPRGSQPPYGIPPRMNPPLWTHTLPPGGPLASNFFHQALGSHIGGSGPQSTLHQLNNPTLQLPPPPPPTVFAGDPGPSFPHPQGLPLHYHPIPPHPLTPTNPDFRPPHFAPRVGPYYHPQSPYSPQLLQNPPLLGAGGLLAPRGPNFPLPPPDPTDVFFQEWVGMVTDRHRERQTATDQDRPMKIPEVRGLLSHAVCLLDSLSECHRELSVLGGRGGEQRTAIVDRTHRWKKELLDIRELVDRGDNLQRLARKLASIKRKRVKVSEGVRRRRREREEERERSERKAQQWVQQKRQDKLKQETERSVQADASGLLGEVKRKQSDIQHHIKLLNSLKELRSFRREAHRKTGDPLVKEDEVFAAESEGLSRLLGERMRLYEEEEHALRVMVQEEVEERMQAGAEGEGVGEEEGREGGDLEPVGGLQPFLDYYLQAESSVEALLNIRKGWDAYLSVEGSPLPRQLPQVPAPFPSSLWNDYYTPNTES